MAAALPLAKLGAILISQIAKPLSNMAKNKAKTSPFFRKYICLPPANLYHWGEVRMRMMAKNLGKPINIPKMTEEQAIELGATMVGEAVIFSVAAFIFIAEYIRSSRKDAAKARAKREEMSRIHSDLKELYFGKAKLEAEVNELIRVLRVSVNVAEDSFHPDKPNFDSIPLRLREDTQKKESGGFWAGVLAFVGKAVDASERIFPFLADEGSKGDGKGKQSNSAATESSSSESPSSTSKSSSNSTTAADNSSSNSSSEPSKNQENASNSSKETNSSKSAASSKS